MWRHTLGCCEIVYFAIPLPKVPFSLLDQERECRIFDPSMVKNSIRTTGVNFAKPRLVFARLRLGWQFTRDRDCPSFFLPKCVLYYNYQREEENLLGEATNWSQGTSIGQSFSYFFLLWFSFFLTASLSNYERFKGNITIHRNVLF